MRAVFGAAEEKAEERVEVRTLGEAVAPTGKKEKPAVIPAMENTFQVGVKRRAPTFVPTSDGKEEDGPKFEAAEAGTDNAQTAVAYGLNKREATAAKAGDGGDNGAAGRAEAAASKRAKRREEGRDDAKRAFWADEANAAADTTADAYEAMPVSDFGKALLRGMGWHEGQGVGQSGIEKGDVAVREVRRRPHRLGLGADATPGTGAARPPA